VQGSQSFHPLHSTGQKQAEQGVLFFDSEHSSVENPQWALALEVISAQDNTGRGLMDGKSTAIHASKLPKL
jgi:hypothetical protein